MREIELTQGKVTLVDDVDYEFLSQWEWCAQEQKRKRGLPSLWIAQRRQRGTREVIRMHVLVAQRAGIYVPGKRIDHRDGDSLHNWRSNLRAATCGQNTFNARKRLDCVSRFKGVNWDRDSGLWRARITQNYRRRSLGRFESERDAALAYDRAAIDLFGEFAKTNF